MDDLSATSSSSDLGLPSNRGNSKKKNIKKIRKLTPLEGFIFFSLSFSFFSLS